MTVNVRPVEDTFLGNSLVSQEFNEVLSRNKNLMTGLSCLSKRLSEARRIETEFVGSDYEDAGTIVDLCLCIKDRIEPLLIRLVEVLVKHRTLDIANNEHHNAWQLYSAHKALLEAVGIYITESLHDQIIELHGV